MDYKKVSIYSTPQAEEMLIGVLLSEGAAGTQVDGGDIPDVSGFDYIDEDDFKTDSFAVSAYFPVSVNLNEKLQSIEERLSVLVKSVPDTDFGDLRVESADVYEADWANEWKKYFHAQKVSDYIVIKPSWEEYHDGSDETVIELDPGMAFGTGSHETTRMCIEFIEEYMEQGAKVIDVGCGSGILSIAAAKLGASSVLALDIDPVAVSVASDNVDKNGVCDKVKVISSDITSDVPVEKEYDIVLANIIADVIIKLNDTVGSFLKKSGMYICSGIIKDRLADVLESLEAHGFRVIEIKEMGEWCAVVCKNRR